MKDCGNASIMSVFANKDSRKFGDCFLTQQSILLLAFNSKTKHFRTVHAILQGFCSNFERINLKRQKEVFNYLFHEMNYCAFQNEVNKRCNSGKIILLEMKMKLMFPRIFHDQLLTFVVKLFQIAQKEILPLHLSNTFAANISSHFKSSA